MSLKSELVLVQVTVVQKFDFAHAVKEEKKE